MVLPRVYNGSLITETCRERGVAIGWASKREREREETSGGTSDGRDRERGGGTERGGGGDRDQSCKMSLFSVLALSRARRRHRKSSQGIIRSYDSSL